MSDLSATRSAALELRDERRAMQEGHVFLDEKCLLLAGEMLRQLHAHAQLQAQCRAALNAAHHALATAVERHGLQDLQVHPAAPAKATSLDIEARSLMGVPLQTARWQTAAGPAPAALDPSPEAEACRRAHLQALAHAAALAAVSGNLERLSGAYRRAMRRARALQDVMLPELDRGLAEIEGRLEEGEQEDAIWMRRGAGA